MRKFVISGGGTGGHIFPAIAIANQIKAVVPDADILFVGAEGKMEMEKVPAAGYPIEGLWISGIQRRLTLDNLSFPFKLLHSLNKARAILKRFRPDAVVGVGGYASGPLLYAATQMGIPALIQEQNSYAGLTNKWLSKRVQAICVAYPGMELYFPADKIHLTGNPVRQDIVALTDQREEALRFFGLSADKPVLLVIGGSQGARSINEAIAAGLPQLLDAGVQVVWQTGKNSFVESEASQNWQAQTGIHRTVFIQEMAKAYTTADVVVSRAGALSVSELCIARKPPIFVPLPTAAEDHQTKNAQALVQANAALLVPNARAATDLLPQTLALLQDKARQAELSQNIAQLARPQAAEAIVETLLGLGR